MTDTKRTRSVLGVTLAATVLVFAACGGGDGGSAKAAASKESRASASAGADQQGEPDLAGIPDVVAEVNGEEVTKDDFVPVYEAQYQQAAAQARMSGQKVDADAIKKQTADNLVDTELLTQEATSRGIRASDQDVDDELTTIAKQNQLSSAQALLDALKKQGTTEEQARSQVETQVLVDRLVTDEAGPFHPTARQLHAIYDRAKQQASQQGAQGQKVPPYAQVKAQLEEQAKSEEVGKVARSLVTELRKDADITINL